MDDSPHCDAAMIPSDRAKPIEIMLSVDHSYQYNQWIENQDLIVQTVQHTLRNVPQNLSSFDLFCRLFQRYHELCKQKHREWITSAATIVIGWLMSMMMQQIIASEARTSQGHGRATAAYKRIADSTGFTPSQIKELRRNGRHNGLQNPDISTIFRGVEKGTTYEQRQSSDELAFSIYSEILKYLGYCVNKVQKLGVYRPQLVACNTTHERREEPLVLQQSIDITEKMIFGPQLFFFPTPTIARCENVASLIIGSAQTDNFFKSFHLEEKEYEGSLPASIRGQGRNPLHNIIAPTVQPILTICSS
ncbi:hypothetical protein OCU04_012794 [Sclerotinia nivalis]|uniref:Uncharacterized protein n=1 Tax=Sclerotinia nivalis TaxID=352851 RepID=A0A9X0A9R0_9HELO|nr:hypothetical protein OCU04_012794 [Sclerotinia nivalis]